MAFKPVDGSPNIPFMELITGNNYYFAKGDLIARDTSGGFATAAISTAADNTIIEGIYVGATGTTAASGTIFIKTIPIYSGLYVVADCTANTADAQLNKAHLLTDARTVNNTTTHSTDKDATFIALRVVGAYSDKKLYGYISKLGQVVS